MRRSCSGLRRAVVEAAAIGVGAAVAGLAFNALRPAGLPLLAGEPYRVLVPCPEPGGPVEAVPPSDPVLASRRTVVVDARSDDAFAARHVPGALHIRYDWLDPVSDEALGELVAEIAARQAQRVVVYGDGGTPDSGEHLGRELSGRGIRSVAFIAGGAPALLGEGP